jgi:glutamate dehydrogenase (NAD(P)+)
VEEMFRFADELGPIKIVHITDPKIGLKAAVAIDNVAAGPSIGGVRMAPDVTTEEAFRLARAMTLKNAAAGLPHGGGKAVIFGDAKISDAKKEPIIRAFARAIGDLTEYIPGPDMGTNETCMAWIKDEMGRSVGLPREIGGIPLDEIGATGFGLAAAVEVAAPDCKLELKGARVVVQGFGAVGYHGARFLAAKGAVLVGAADSRGSIANPEGIDIAGLRKLKKTGKGVADWPDGTKGDADAVIDIECDIWIPAARPDVLRADNVDRLRTRMVAEGANIPATPEAEARLEARGVLVLPDFITNAGGVICAAVEYHGGAQKVALDVIDEKLRANTEEVLDAAKRDKVPARTAALRVASERVKRAMTFRK